MHTRKPRAWRARVPTYLSTTVEPDIHYTQADIIERAPSFSLLFSYLLLSSPFVLSCPLWERRGDYSRRERGRDGKNEEDRGRDGKGFLSLLPASPTITAAWLAYRALYSPSLRYPSDFRLSNFFRAHRLPLFFSPPPSPLSLASRLV